MTKKETYISFIIDQLKSGTVDYVKVSSQFCTKFHKTQRTFAAYWKIAQLLWKDQQGVINAKKHEQYIESETSAVKTILKTKFERLVILQKQIDNCVDELNNGMTEDTMLIGGRPQKVHRKHTVNETTRLRQTMQGLQAEISKIEGDYAAEKRDITVNKPVIFDFGD